MEKSNDKIRLYIENSKANDSKIDYRKHEKVELFLDELANQIHTEHEAKDIKDELYDHIENSIDEYVDMDYGIETAISKSLLSMGDPKEIGYSFTNYDLMKKRKMLMYFFKIFGMMLFMSIVLFIDYREFIINGDQTGVSMMILSISVIYFSLTMPLKMFARPLRSLDINKTPLFIIWPVKKKLDLEYKFLMLIFSPIPILMTAITFYESAAENRLIYTSAILGLFILSIFMFLHSEKYRIPKYMIIEDGVIIKNKFTSWTAIEGCQWRSIKEKDKILHTLTFTNKKRLSVTSKIVISDRQKAFLSKILSEKIYV